MSIKSNNIPQHVAIIMDGNRRWARKRGLPVVAGHKHVVDSKIEELIEAAAEAGVGYITFWAWSCDNWSRSSDEVGGIMSLFRWALKRKAKRFIERGARLRVIGDWRALDKDIVEDVEKVIELSATNDKINVTFALNYNGRDEIVRGIKALIKSKIGANDEVVEITADEFSRYLDTAELPDPDLIIRTGGEQRLSGFLLWQCEYSELYFPETLMPDFGKVELIEALSVYQQRERRLGK